LQHKKGNGHHIFACARRARRSLRRKKRVNPDPDKIRLATAEHVTVSGGFHRNKETKP